MDKSLVLFEAVTLVRGDRVLIQDFSWAMAPGQIWALRGENGAGKTSLLRAAAGLLMPFMGQIKQTIGFSFLGHELALKPYDFARDYLSQQALEAWDLNHLADVPLAALSAGQRKRVALARTCQPEKQLWLLDEPFANLDADQAQQLGRRLQDQAGQGGGILFSTHEDRSLGQNLSLKNGRVHYAV